MSPELLAYARAFAHENHAEALRLLRMLARIPAPSHHEEWRAAEIKQWMQKNGMGQAYVDNAKNVICPFGDDGTCDLVVFAAHTDVVFPDTVELPLREEGGRLYAPGVGDDTANLVALLMAARHLAQNPQLIPDGLGLLIVANSCEEGLGNLRGTKRLFKNYGSRIRRFYSFDLYLPQVIDEAVGSHRWKIEVRTQGGHSYSNFGRPNAIERLCAIIQALYALPLPQDVPCTINVGHIEGGTTVNAIAAQAKALFEYRSTSDATLRDMYRLVRRTVEGFASEDVEVSIRSVGKRPASARRIEGLTQVSELSREVMRAVTGEEPSGEAASTDANVPLSLGIPANTIGAVRGALLHTRDEWIDAASVEEGMAVVMGIMLVQAELGQV